MIRVPRLLAGTALTFALTGLPVTAVADVTVPTTLPTSLPTESPPVAVPTVAVPLPPTQQPPPPAPAAPPARSAPSAGETGPALPEVSLPAVPHPPAPPSSEGGEPQPAEEEGTSHGAGRTAQGSPVGDDALPAELEAALCTALSEVLGPLPAQVKGLPTSVVDELPAEVTDLVPADVLTTVTLRCPAAETHDPPATAPTEVRSVTTKRTAKAPARPASAPREQARAGFGSLPHTGLVAGIPLAGAALLLTGLALRRTGRARAQGR